MEKTLIFSILVLCVVPSANAGLFGYDSREECVNKELQKHKQPNRAAESAVRQYCIEKFPERIQPYRFEKLRLGRDAVLTCFENTSKEKLNIIQKNGKLTMPIISDSIWEVTENNRVNSMRFWNHGVGKQGEFRGELHINPYFGNVYLTMYEVKKNKSHNYIFSCRED